MEIFTTDEIRRMKEFKYHPDWPPREFYHYASKITSEQVDKLQELIENNISETQIDQYLRKNPALLTAPLKWSSTGHHGAWVLAQQVIKPKLGQSKPGMIPDFIVGGKNSGGFEWWVIELKGANHKLFTRKGHKVYFSDVLNKGICQTLGYIDYCSEIQAHIRDQLCLNDFREPNALILIGRDSELAADEQKRKLRAAWNRLHKSRLEIRTYDALLGAIEELAVLWRREKST